MTSRLSSADAAWLHMERSTNLMVVNSVLLFDQPVDYDRLRGVIMRRLLERYPRFGQRVVESRLPLSGPVWEDDPELDLDSHLHRIALPEPRDEAALQELVGDLASTPLDRAKPLWDMYLIEGREPGPALLWRVHHCVADGVALVSVLLSLADDSPEPPEGPPPGAHLVRWPASMVGLAGTTTAAVAAGGRLASALTHESLETILHPRHLSELAHQAADVTAALAHVTFMPADHDTVLRGELGHARSVTWTSPLSLARIARVGKAHHATVNDVLLAAVSGALRQYLIDHGEQPQEIRAIVPFNLRPPGEPVPRELGNHFGLVFVSLPVDVAHARERLARVKRTMDRIKHSPEAPVSYAALEVIGLTPPEVEGRWVDMLSAKGTAVITNIPGPREPIRIAGARVGRALAWAPTSGGVGMSVSIFSYRGQVSVGLLVDSHVISDPQAIVDLLEAEVDALGNTRDRAAASIPPAPVGSG